MSMKKILSINTITKFQTFIYCRSQIVPKKNQGLFFISFLAQTTLNAVCNSRKFIENNTGDQEKILPQKRYLEPQLRSILELVVSKATGPTDPGDKWRGYLPTIYLTAWPDCLPQRETNSNSFTEKETICMYIMLQRFFLCTVYCI